MSIILNLKEKNHNLWQDYLRRIYFLEKGENNPKREKRKSDWENWKVGPSIYFSCGFAVGKGVVIFHNFQSLIFKSQLLSSQAKQEVVVSRKLKWRWEMESAAASDSQVVRNLLSCDLIMSRSRVQTSYADLSKSSAESVLFEPRP